MENHFISGEWCGFYIEPHKPERGWMHLFLTFENGVVRGEGTDYVGPWVAKGSYDDSNGNCAWTKQYLGQHQVEYFGNCTKNGIQGDWRILSEGPFHIWPKSHSHFNELYLRDELEIPEEFGRSVLLDPVSDDDLV